MHPPTFSFTTSELLFGSTLVAADGAAAGGVFWLHPPTISFATSEIRAGCMAGGGMVVDEAKLGFTGVLEGDGVTGGALVEASDTAATGEAKLGLTGALEFDDEVWAAEYDGGGHPPSPKLLPGTPGTATGETIFHAFDDWASPPPVLSLEAEIF